MRPVPLAAAFLFATAPAAFADTLVVGNKAEDTVSFIDLDTGEEVARRETGPAPHEIALSPDGRTAVVVSYARQGYQGNTLHVFDVETASETKVIDLGTSRAPHGLKWIPGTSRVIATTEATEDVVVADIDSGTVVARAKTDQPGTHMVALSPDGETAYTANIAGGSVTVLGLDPLEKKRDVAAGAGTEGITVSPDGRELWVGNNDSRDVVIFDIETLTEKERFSVEDLPIRIEMSPDGAHVAISHPQRHEVVIVGAGSRETVATVDLAAHDARVPVTLLWAPDNETLFAAATGSAAVAAIDTTDWAVRDVYEAGAGSDGLGLTTVDVQPAE